MVLVLGWPMVLVLPKVKPVLGVVVVEPKGLKRLPAGCWAGGPNIPPVVVPKVPVAAGQKNRVSSSQFLLYVVTLNHSLAPNVVLFAPKLKLELEAAPNRPVAALDVAVVPPNRLPVPGARGLVGPFLPAW